MSQTKLETVLIALNPVPPAGLLALAVRTWRWQLQGFSEIRGQVFQNVPLASVVLLFYDNPAAGPIYTQSVLVSGSQPPFTYTFKEPARGRYVDLKVTNGAVASATFRAFCEASPTV